MRDLVFSKWAVARSVKKEMATKSLKERNKRRWNAASLLQNCEPVTEMTACFLRILGVLAAASSRSADAK
jgi:hypothetical protein